VRVEHRTGRGSPEDNFAEQRDQNPEKGGRNLIPVFHAASKASEQFRKADPENFCKYITFLLKCKFFPQKKQFYLEKKAGWIIIPETSRGTGIQTGQEAEIWQIH